MAALDNCRRHHNEHVMSERNLPAPAVTRLLRSTPWVCNPASSRAIRTSRLVSFATPPTSCREQWAIT
jgi:hypothetical protein